MLFYKSELLTHIKLWCPKKAKNNPSLTLPTREGMSMGLAPSLVGRVT
jgi:hypothetical protein